MSSRSAVERALCADGVKEGEGAHLRSAVFRCVYSYIFGESADVS